MYLKSLEISGFKSFAKKATLDFTSPITAIVGPNGSGKSNIAEAFRFVLGEQSIKSMRGKRGEDLIFNGGKSASRLNRASVKVTFDNTKRIMNLDFDEVTIERAVHRDSANEYFINGSAVRLKDIIELLAGAHIGASGHHIISQGEADKILNANLHERREIIEEALGLKIYHYKREESERKLEKTEENLKQVESLRREIAPHIKFLSKQVEKIEKAREMRIELLKLYQEYFKREQMFITYEKDTITSERTNPEENKKRLEYELSEAKKILEKSDLKDVKSEALLSLETELRSIREQKDALARNIGRIEGQISAETRIAQKQLDMQKSDETKMLRLIDVQAVESEISGFITEAESSGDILSIKAILNKIREALHDFILKNKNEADLSVIADSEREMQKLQDEKLALMNEQNSLATTEREANDSYSKLQREIEKEKDSNRDAEKAVFKIMAEMNEVISTLNFIKNREDRLQIIDGEFKRELQEAAVLVGRAVLDFEHFELLSPEGAKLMIDGAANEDRHVQDERRKVIERIKIRLEDSGGGSGEEVVKEYQEATSRDEFLSREIEDLRTSAETLRVLIKDLEEKLTTEFKLGVEKINKQFQDFFALMFGGGSASLEVVREEKKRRKVDTSLELDDEEEMAEAAFASETEASAAEEGIDINVNLPQKKVKSLMMLSGGERALTSIALLFAISQVNPPPFIILDETDAALDEANSRKYGDMVDSLSKFSELILITHNRETMARAGVLYGITMGSEGFSRLLSIQFDEAVTVAK